MTTIRKPWVIVLALVILAGAGFYAWQTLGRDNLLSGIASGNGRIEAVEIDIASKTPGRIQDILVREGDFVRTGQDLARMDTTQLQAQLRQAKAQHRGGYSEIQSFLAVREQRLS
jgi:HlyD family secretion protein